MDSIINVLKETIKVEENKDLSTIKLSEFENLVKKLDEFGCSLKPNYSLPLVDTIGKTTYPLLNKQSK